MRLIAAPTRELGQDFVIVLVKDSVIQTAAERDQIVASAQQMFGRRAALMGERHKKTYGPPDIVRWLEGVLFEQLPWREFDVN